MEGRSGRLQRLNAFRRALPHVSASALSAVLAEVDRSGVPESHSRSDLQRATALVLNDITPYGPLLCHLELKTKRGMSLRMPALNPAALLHKAFSRPGCFQRLMNKRLEECPSTPEAPWRLALYTDEIVPGSPLAHENLRKVWVVYFSFLELGAAILSREDAWFCILVARSSLTAEVSAGIAQIVGGVIKLFFGAEHNLAHGGACATHSRWTFPEDVLQARHGSARWRCAQICLALSRRCGEQVVYVVPQSSLN